MKKLFWTLKKKAELKQKAKTMTLRRLSMVYKKSEEEVSRVLNEVYPAYNMIESVRIVGGIRMTKFKTAWAYGLPRQFVGGAGSNLSAAARETFYVES